MDLADPQQNHGYTYGNGNPVTFSDPTGLDPCPSTACEHHDPGTIATLRGTSQAEGEKAVASTRRQYEELGIEWTESTVKKPVTTQYCDSKCERHGARATAVYRAGANKIVDHEQALDPGSMQVLQLWLLHAAPSRYEFGDGDRFTNEVRSQDWIAYIKDLLSRCTKCGVGRRYDGLGYSTVKAAGGDSEMLQLLALIDMSSFGTHTIGKGSGDLSKAVLGSYGLSAQFTSYDSKAGEARVQFHLTNVMTVESATRDPSLKGYAEGAQNGSAAKVFSLLYGDSPLPEPVEIDMTWTETIQMRGPMS